MPPVPHPPYSPDLTLSDPFLFPWMKKVFKGKYFADVEEVKQTNKQKKNSRSTTGTKIHKLKNCFEQWEKSLHGCIASNGEYFEVD